MRRELIISSIGLASLLSCQQKQAEYLEQSRQEQRTENKDRLKNYQKRYDTVWNTLLALEGRNDIISSGDYTWYKRMMIDLKTTHNTFDDMVHYLNILEKNINEYTAKLSSKP